ncbi:MAG: hypothetical protein AAF771_08440 [Pseudomonadota bacterium]
MFVALTLIGGALIGLRAYLNPTGFVTPDSAAYLAVAQNLLNGAGFEMANGGFGTARDIPFALWPVGYPVGIAGLSLGTGVTPFVASKLLNALAFGAAGWLIWRAGGGRLAPIAVLFFGAPLDFYSFTWSEGPFFALLLTMVLLIARILADPGRLELWTTGALATCCVALFLVRYVGAFSVTLLVLPPLLAARAGNWSRAALACLIGLCAAVLIAAYLGWNIARTGHATGAARAAAFQSHVELFADLAHALWSELVFAVSVYHRHSVHLVAVGFQALSIIALVTAIHRAGPAMPIPRAVRATVLALLAVGLAYLASVIGLRWSRQFDPFGFRLLAPGTLLLMLAGAFTLLHRYPGAAHATSAVLAVNAALSVFLAIAPLATGSSRYPDATQAVLARLAPVSPGSVVALGDERLRYLRPDLHLARPSIWPYVAEDEPWDRFMARIDPTRPVYLDLTAGRALLNRYGRPVPDGIRVGPGLLKLRAGNAG